MPSPSPSSELDRFRALILSDARLQHDLQAHDDLAAFGARAADLAVEHGIALTADAMQSGMRGDPIGLSRWSAIPLCAAPPEKDWLPINLASFDGQLCIDWAYFGARQLAELFFEDSVRAAMMHPLNQLVKCRTRLSDLPAWVKQNPGLEPSGFIFHMSRCGSTLVSQMLASDPRNDVISEASPIDAALQIDQAVGGAQGTILAAMIGAFGRKRDASERRHFIKLDSWHARALPLFRKAFPNVPWVFLYREPSEVLASQTMQPGMHVVPNLVPPALFGLDVEDQFPLERHCAAVVGKICEAVLKPYSEGGGLLVNYCELPQALWTRILPHFGIACSDAEREIMAAAATYDAKTPGVIFSPDASNERRNARLLMQPLAEQYLGEVYRRLEYLRIDMQSSAFESGEQAGP